jgi:hypothetical protein
MNTYEILRNLDYLKTAVDNLWKEIFNSGLFPALYSTREISPLPPKEESLEDMFRTEIRRIDEAARLLNDYTDSHKRGNPS